MSFEDSDVVRSAVRVEGFRDDEFNYQLIRALGVAAAVLRADLGHEEEVARLLPDATAAEVARSREGDCTEHAVLLAALARARGIPARVAMGLVYVR